MTFLLFNHADADCEGYEQGEAHQLFAGCTEQRADAELWLREHEDGCVYNVEGRTWCVLYDGQIVTPAARDEAEEEKRVQWALDHPREVGQMRELLGSLAYLVSDARYAMEPGVMQLLVQISPQSGQTLTIPKLGTIELEDNDNADD
jgi:hypothetical protein